MPRQLRSSYDAEDFVCAAIYELLSNPTGLPYRGPATLVLLAKRRMIDELRSPRARVTQLRVDLAERRPACPSIEAEADELRQQLVADAGPDRELVVDLRCQGFTTHEIAELTGIKLRTVQRMLKAFARTQQRSMPNPKGVDKASA